MVLSWYFLWKKKRSHSCRIARIKIRKHNFIYWYNSWALITRSIVQSGDNWTMHVALSPISVAVRSRAWTVFAGSNAGIVGSNPTEGMNVCVCLFCVCVLSCVQVAALRRADSPSKESYRLCKISRNWKSGQSPTKGCRSIDRLD
jgi:hypothetical protein